LVDLVDGPKGHVKHGLLVAANCLQMPKRRRSGTEGRPLGGKHVDSQNKMVQPLQMEDEHYMMALFAQVKSFQMQMYIEKKTNSPKNTHLVLEGHISPNIGFGVLHDRLASRERFSLPLTSSIHYWLIAFGVVGCREFLRCRTKRVRNLPWAKSCWELRVNSLHSAPHDHLFPMLSPAASTE